MTAIATKSNSEKVTLAALARETLRDCDGDTQKAIKTLTQRLRKDEKLLESLIADIIRDAVQMHTHDAMRHDRGAILNRASRGDVEALARGLKNAFLDMWLESGLRLRDATREQVSAKAKEYESLSRNTGHKARWLALIAQSVPNDSKVGEALSEDRVAELYKETA